MDAGSFFTRDRAPGRIFRNGSTFTEKIAKLTVFDKGAATVPALRTSLTLGDPERDVRLVFTAPCSFYFIVYLPTTRNLLAVLSLILLHYDRCRVSVDSSEARDW